MSVKEWLESEIKRHNEIYNQISWFNGEISRQESLIRVVRTTNQASTNNFRYDWGYYFPWFKENFERFKDKDSNAYYYWLSNNGTDEEKKKLWNKERELAEEGVAVIQFELNKVIKQREEYLENIGYIIETYAAYEGGYTATENVSMILIYLRAMLKVIG